MLTPAAKTAARAVIRLVVLLTLGSLFLSCSSPPSRSSRYERLIVSVPSDGFTNFETEPVRPLALSPDGRYLYALNTADDRLEIFDAQGEQLRSIGETAVGLRPVAIALRGKQAWVVNHLSDSVSVVDISDPTGPKVVHTLQVGDEPRGIIVAGPNQDRVFVAAAYRGETLTPGIGRAQLWIFDAERPEAPAQKLMLFGAKPRALAASADGRQVFAAVYLSGNGTTSISGEDAVRLGRAPRLYFDSIPYSAIPKQGPIVRRIDDHWRDEQGRDWSAAVPFELPDYDLFVVDAAAQQARVVQSISSVGTVLFNVAVQPGSGEIWVSNTEAFNHVAHESRLKGRFAHNRITRVIPEKSGYRVVAVNLNPHIEAAMPAAASRDLSLGQPLDLVFRPDGREAFVAAFGSGKIGVLDQTGRVVDRITVGFAPAGLALDPSRGRLYVLHHFDASISVVDARQRRLIGRTALRHDPTPALIKNGRRFFYDAALTSGFGDLSCATCHVFGDTDGLAWDLGDTAGPRVDYPMTLRSVGLAEPKQSLHPLKGPMVTQTLRGLEGTAPYHWRGDRFGLPLAPGRDLESLKDFNPAFVDLLGRSEPLDEKAMEALARYVFSIRFPPNPLQRIDRLRDSEEQSGFEFFTGPFLSGAGQQNCASCHQLPTGTNRMINFEGIQVGRDMKTAQLRNLYDKIGRFNVPGPQISGFGFLHDGTFDTVVNFLRLDVFLFPGESEAEKDIVRRQLHHYLMAFDTGMAPAVGRQLTVPGKPSAEQRKLLDLLEIRAAAEECDLTARVWEAGRQRGWLYRDYKYHADRVGQEPLDTDALLARYADKREPITVTCVPPGDGRRSALDRDLNGILDDDESFAR